MLLITTGGTIGGDPYPNPLRAPANVTHSWYNPQRPPRETDPVIRFMQGAELLQDGDRYIPMEPVDSKKITEERLNTIAQLITDSPADYVVVTIGTDTILDCAARLAFMLSKKTVTGRGWAAPARPVVLLGSMVPLLNDPLFGGAYNSDGIQNLCAVQKGSGLLKQGVSICLSGYNKEDQFVPMLYGPDKLDGFVKYVDPLNNARSRLITREAARLLEVAA